MFEAIFSVLCFFGNFICILAKFFTNPVVLFFVVFALIKRQMN